MLACFYLGVLNFDRKTFILRLPTVPVSPSVSHLTRSFKVTHTHEGSMHAHEYPHVDVTIDHVAPRSDVQAGEGKAPPIDIIHHPTTLRSVLRLQLPVF